MSDPKNAAAIGIAISSTCICVTALDEYKHAIENFEQALGSESPVTEQVGSLMDERSVSPDTPVCVAVPGMIDSRSGRIVNSRIPELRDVDLSASLSMPKLIVENDANAAAYAEFVLGAGRGCRNLFCVSLGEGVGSGLILDGKIWRGANGFAGEFGAIVVDEEGTRLEDVASKANIVRRTRNRVHQDRTTTLRRMREDEISFRDILNAAEIGDDLALLMLERTGMFLGTALASVINLLDVEKVVIAGEVVRTPSAILDAAIRRARESSSSRAFNAAEIELSQLDEFASSTGAALIAADAFKKN
jgi:glucokinase